LEVSVQGSRKVPFGDWDEVNQQWAGADGCGYAACFLGAVVGAVLLKLFHVRTSGAIAAGVLMAFPIQWLIMLFVFPFVAGAVRCLRYGGSQSDQGVENEE
jgi:hypothetical protein